MCRWMAYSGSPIPVAELLLKPKHSLIDQSLHSRMGATTTNGDGFGLGWYGVGDTPGVFHSTEPAWNDRNLADLAKHLVSPLVFAHVRASTGGAIQQTNCHPFRLRELAVDAQRADPRVRHGQARPGVRGGRRRSIPMIEGSTDSEMFFYLALTMGLQDDPLTRRRAGGRLHRGHRPPPWGGEPDPDDGGHHRRHQHLGLPLLQRGPVALAVPQHERRDAARRCTRTTPCCTRCPTRPG